VKRKETLCAENTYLLDDELENAEIARELVGTLDDQVVVVTDKDIIELGVGTRTDDKTKPQEGRPTLN